MGLFDFLANAAASSDNPMHQAAGAYFGGVDPFRQQTSQLYDEMDKATTREEIRAVGMKFAKAWVASGRPMNEHFTKALEGFTAPALKNVQGNELDSIQRDYGPQTTPITPQVAPEGQGQQIDPNQMLTPQTTPARDPYGDPEGAFRMLRATGANAEQFRQGFAHGPEMASKAASTAHTQQRIADEQAVAQQREGLSTEPVGDTGVSPRQLATSPSLTALFPQRERPADPLEEQKRQHLEASTNRLLRPPPEPKAPADTPAMRDFIKIGGDPTDEAAFMDFLQKRAKAGRKPSPMEEYLAGKKGGGGTPAKPGAKRTLEEIAKDAFK